MKAIKFSHKYPKLHGQITAELLAVKPLRIDRNTPDLLLEYDTTYYEIDKKNKWIFNERRFPLPTGDYIQLIFLGNLRIPFCTIRKAYPPSKIDYYKSAIGETFAVVIKEGGAA